MAQASDSKKQEAAQSTSPPTTSNVLVVEKKKKKKKKRKYSRGTKDAQRFQLGFQKSLARLGDGAAKGLLTFYDESDRSASRKRDGAIRDALTNWSEGISEFTRVAGKAPNDLVKSLPINYYWRQTRSSADPFFSFFGFIR